MNVTKIHKKILICDLHERLGGDINPNVLQ